MRCVRIQESWVDWSDPRYDKVGNILLSRILGADIRMVQAGFGIGFKESWEAALAEVEAAGGKPGDGVSHNGELPRPRAGG